MSPCSLISVEVIKTTTRRMRCCRFFIFFGFMALSLLSLSSEVLRMQIARRTSFFFTFYYFCSTGFDQIEKCTAAAAAAAWENNKSYSCWCRVDIDRVSPRRPGVAFHFTVAPLDHYSFNSASPVSFLSYFVAFFFCFVVKPLGGLKLIRAHAHTLWFKENIIFNVEYISH